MSMSFADALIKTRNGRAVFMQARSIPDRIQELKNLVHDTFVLPARKGGYRPDFRICRFDVYKACRDRIVDLAKGDPAEFDAAIAAVKFAWTSRQAYDAAIETITYSDDLDAQHETEHDFRSYESSDVHSR